MWSVPHLCVSFVFPCPQQRPLLFNFSSSSSFLFLLDLALDTLLPSDILPHAAALCPLRCSPCTPAVPCLFHAQPRVGWWDAAAQQWVEDGITEILYSPETRILGFHTVCLSSLAVLQSRTLEFPYLSWTLQPMGAERATLTINCRRMEIEIEIGAGWVALMKAEEPELRPLVGERMGPGMPLSGSSRPLQIVC
jgi:hypothetical protein